MTRSDQAQRGLARPIPTCSATSWTPPSWILYARNFPASKASTSLLIRGAITLPFLPRTSGYTVLPTAPIETRLYIVPNQSGHSLVLERALQYLFVHQFLTRGPRWRRCSVMVFNNSVWTGRMMKTRFAYENNTAHAPVQRIPAENETVATSSEENCPLRYIQLHCAHPFRSAMLYHRNWS